MQKTIFLLALALMVANSTAQAQSSANFQKLENAHRAYFEAASTHFKALSPDEAKTFTELLTRTAGAWEKDMDAFLRAQSTEPETLRRLAADLNAEAGQLVPLVHPKAITDSLSAFSARFFDQQPSKIWQAALADMEADPAAADQLPCYTAFEADHAFAGTLLSACFENSSAPTQADCIAAYFLATAYASEGFENCMKQTYGTSGQ